MPYDDPFYIPPAGFQNAAPGTNLRSRSVTVTLPAGIPVPVRATQTLFRTTDTQGRPVTSVQTLLMPGIPWLIGKRPLVGFQTPIDGTGDQCNPSYKLQTGGETENLAQAAPLLLKGYAVTMVDYEGPRNAYGAGVMAGQATLDGVRAAQRVSGSGLAGSNTPVALWGYSGGAIATGWAAQLQPSYAPELKLKAVALGGTPIDFISIGRRMDGSFMSGIFLLGVVGVSREYSELDSFRPLLNDAGREVERKLADVCIGDAALMYPFRKFSDFTTVADPLSDPRAVEFAEKLKMGKIGPKAPVYLYHGLLDEGMPFEDAVKLKQNWCAKGTRVKWSVNPIGDHIITAAAEVPGVVKYISDRFDGWFSPPNNC